MAENKGENLLIEEDEDQESKSKSQEVEFVPVETKADDQDENDDDEGGEDTLNPCQKSQLLCQPCRWFQDSWHSIYYAA